MAITRASRGRAGTPIEHLLGRLGTDELRQMCNKSFGPMAVPPSATLDGDKRLVDWLINHPNVIPYRIARMADPPVVYTLSDSDEDSDGLASSILSDRGERAMAAPSSHSRTSPSSPPFPPTSPTSPIRSLSASYKYASPSYCSSSDRSDSLSSQSSAEPRPGHPLSPSAPTSSSLHSTPTRSLIPLVVVPASPHQHSPTLDAALSSPTAARILLSLSTGSAASRPESSFRLDPPSARADDLTIGAVLYELRPAKTLRHLPRQPSSSPDPLSLLWDTPTSEDPSSRIVPAQPKTRPKPKRTSSRHKEQRELPPFRAKLATDFGRPAPFDMGRSGLNRSSKICRFFNAELPCGTRCIFRHACETCHQEGHTRLGCVGDAQTGEQRAAGPSGTVSSHAA